jgi:hypothetical protein
MPNVDIKKGWRGRGLLLMLALLIALALMIPSPTYGTASTADPDSVTVPTSVLRRSIAVIDSLDAHIAYQDSVIVAQKDYYVELLAIQDEHIKKLREIIDDVQPSVVKDFLEKLLWGAAGYGLRAAGD